MMAGCVSARLRVLAYRNARVRVRLVTHSAGPDLAAEAGFELHIVGVRLSRRSRER